MKNNYLKFLLMISISFVIMYAVMFFNVAEFRHIYLNVTRLYMTLIMVAPMAIVMILMMWKMYKNKGLNLVIIVVSATILLSSTLFLRNQSFIGDVQFMRAMIPHHSSAILTSEEANIKDSEVRVLADEIIKTQKEEIAEMERLLEKLGK